MDNGEIVVRLGKREDAVLAYHSVERAEVSCAFSVLTRGLRWDFSPGIFEVVYQYFALGESYDKTPFFRHHGNPNNHSL